MISTITPAIAWVMVLSRARSSIAADHPRSPSGMAGEVPAGGVTGECAAQLDPCASLLSSAA
jgi:hypothetical protein